MSYNDYVFAQPFGYPASSAPPSASSSLSSSVSSSYSSSFSPCNPFPPPLYPIVTSPSSSSSSFSPPSPSPPEEMTLNLRNGRTVSTSSSVSSSAVSKPRKNDLSKKLADQRWRQSINERYAGIKKILERGRSFHGDRTLKSVQIKSKNDLMDKSIKTIDQLEEFLSSMTIHLTQSLTEFDKLDHLKERFVAGYEEKFNREASS